MFKKKKRQIDGMDALVSAIQILKNDRWREQRKPKKHREDCFWYDEDQDMSMRIPVCEYKTDPPECYIDECPTHCKTYIEREEAMNILREYVRRTEHAQNKHLRD